MKKKLSVFLAAALVFSMLGVFAAGSSAASSLYGDVDGNGKIASLDVVLLKRHLAKWNVTVDLTAADVDGNEKVNSTDAVILARYLAKWTFENKVGTPIPTTPAELSDIKVSLSFPAETTVQVGTPVQLTCLAEADGSPEYTYVYFSENADAVSVSPDGLVTAKCGAETEITVYVRAYYPETGKTLVGSASVSVKAIDSSAKTQVVSGAYSAVVLADDGAAVAETLSSGISSRLGFTGTVSSKPSLDSASYALIVDLKGETAASLGLTSEVSQMQDDGFILKLSGNTLYCLAKTQSGADRAVRFVLNQYADETAKTLAVPSNLVYMQSVGVPVKKVTVNGNPLSDYSVVCPAGASESMTFAAEELVSYIRQATGITLPVVAESSSDRVFELAADTDEKYGDDGFTLRSQNGKVTISGAAKRGVLYGVYEFLEDYIGWRFIFDDLEFVYPADEINVPDGIQDTQLPSFYSRDSQSLSYDGDHLNAAVKRKINSWKNREALHKSATKYGLGVGYIGTAHTYQDYIKSINNTAQPCLSDESIYEECLSGVLEKLRSHEERNYPIPLISVSQMDNYKYCTCPRCTRVNQQEYSYAGTTVRFINRMAAAVAEVYPDTDIWTLSYQWSRKPTQTEVSDDVTIMWAFEGCYNHPLNAGECSAKGIGLQMTGFEPQQNTNYDSYMHGWLEKADNVWCWYYAQEYLFYLCPMPAWDVHRQNYRYLAESGIQGIYAEGFYGSDPTEGYGFDRMNVYLLAKLAWNPYMSESEYNAVTEEYLAAAYGSGWRYLREYLDLWTAAGNASGCWMGNYNQPQEIVSFEYYSENYAKMCELFDNAEKYADTAEQAELIGKFRCHMEYLALCADYKTMFENGTAEQKAAYQQRYSALVQFMKDHNVPYSWNGVLPETDEVTASPLAWYGITNDKIRN